MSDLICASIVIPLLTCLQKVSCLVDGRRDNNQPGPVTLCSSGPLIPWVHPVVSGIVLLPWNIFINVVFIQDVRPDSSIPNSGVLEGRLPADSGSYVTLIQEL